MKGQKILERVSVKLAKNTLQKVMHQIFCKAMNKYCIENKQYIMNNNQIKKALKLFINCNISNLYCID